jgi:hypothetical protein
MRRDLIAPLVVLSVVTLALVGCGSSQVPSTGTLAAAASTTAPTLVTTTTQAPTTTTTMATTTTTTMVTTTTTEAPTTTTTAQKLVKVPSYTAFTGSYSGDDMGKALDSWEAAVKAGFHKVGLIADIVLVIPGDPEYQSPKAGKMVPKGTVVHIQVAVWD